MCTKQFNIVLSVLEGCGHEDFDPRKKLDSLMHLAELCIEVIQQNEEYHAEVRQNFTFLKTFFLESLKRKEHTIVLVLTQSVNSQRAISRRTFLDLQQSAVEFLFLPRDGMHVVQSAVLLLS